MATITHFDLQANDPERAVKFYENLFGWTSQKFEEPAEYWMLNIPGVTEKTGLSGGIYRSRSKMEGVQNSSILCYFSVENIDEHAEKVKKLGGQLLGEKIEVTGIGYMYNCADTEGNVFALWEDIPQ